jgi:hypothetical protein
MLYFEANLTKQEEKARDEMIYLFNPVLKFFLMNSNPKEFFRYGCNSCRQTAILGAGHLRKLLPDYSFSIYEGSFIENVNGEYTPYTHMFIIASKGNRNLVIDLSRTSKRLLFQETNANMIYPEIEDYDDVIKIGQKKLDLDDLLNTECPEYFTGWKPSKFMEIISITIDILKNKTKEEQMKFCDNIYTKTTSLRR